MSSLVRHGSASEMVRAACKRMQSLLAEAVAARGAASAALSGGRTPEPIYAELSRAPLDWRRIAVTLTDERLVPPEDPASNAGMLARSLLRGDAAACAFTRLWSPGPDAAAAADLALAAMTSPFDLVVLGMGEDGHTASLFPQTPELAQGLDAASPRRCIAVGSHDPAPPQPRLTLTLPALLNARRILLLITGDRKLEVLETALAGDDIYAMPIRAVLRQDKAPVDIVWAPEP